ncbi:hypothetical protein RND81_01G049800 [Saponaria officinalis]|uniref:Uncharacterized protein n=1 Tax=Saponaria officinalis TaxID=3572 RepID=A0AAW1NCK6_SAPOF
MGGPPLAGCSTRTDTYSVSAHYLHFGSSFDRKPTRKPTEKSERRTFKTLMIKVQLLSTGLIQSARPPPTYTARPRSASTVAQSVGMAARYTARSRSVGVATVSPRGHG